MHFQCILHIYFLCCNRHANANKDIVSLLFVHNSSFAKRSFVDKKMVVLINVSINLNTEDCVYCKEDYLCRAIPFPIISHFIFIFLPSLFTPIYGTKKRGGGGGDNNFVPRIWKRRNF